MRCDKEYPSNIKPLMPSGTNSTMFTECCGTAIGDDEMRCPSCKRLVVGHDVESGHKRGLVRWRNATATWKRSG